VQLVVLSKLKHVFLSNTMLQLYHTLVHSLLSYGIIIWGEATFPTYMQKLKSQQNRAIRAISNCHFREEIKPYYSQLNILQPNEIYKYEIAKFVFCWINNKTPSLFHNYFLRTSEHSSRFTRRSNDVNHFHIPRYRTNKLQRCIKYQGVKVWNSTWTKSNLLQKI